MIEYKSAKIHIRKVRENHYCGEWSWADHASERKGGATRKTELQAISATKQVIDAEIASQDVNAQFFRRKLIG